MGHNPAVPHHTRYMSLLRLGTLDELRRIRESAELHELAMLEHLYRDDPEGDRLPLGLRYTLGKRRNDLASGDM